VTWLDRHSSCRTLRERLRFHPGRLSSKIIKRSRREHKHENEIPGKTSSFTMGNVKIILFCLFAAFGGFLFGYDIGVISGCLIMTDFARRFGNGDMDPATGLPIINANRQSIITSLLSAGTFVGSLGQAFTSDWLGRRKSIWVWTFLFTIGTLIQTASDTSITQLSIGRFIAGLGVGALSAIVPLYNGETAPKKLRGMILCLYQLMIIIGIFLSYVIDLGTHNISNSASWRIPVGLQMLWGLIIMGGIMFLPESPRYLLGKKRVDQARRSIATINSVPEDHPIVQETMQELDEAIREENEGGKAGWLECFSTRNVLWKRTINGMMLQFIQQLNGQNFYIATITATLSSEMPEVSCLLTSSKPFWEPFLLSELSLPFI